MPLEQTLSSIQVACSWYLGFPGGSAVKKPPAMQEMRVRSLGQGDPLGEGMTSHSSVLAWRIPWTKEPGRLQSIGLQRIGHNWSDWAQHSWERTWSFVIILILETKFIATDNRELVPTWMWHRTRRKESQTVININRLMWNLSILITIKGY